MTGTAAATRDDAAAALERRRRQDLIEAAALSLGYSRGAIRHWRNDRRVSPAARFRIARLLSDRLGLRLEEGDFVAVEPTRKPLPAPLPAPGDGPVAKDA
jgi:hypothetical protein